MGRIYFEGITIEEFQEAQIQLFRKLFDEERAGGNSSDRDQYVTRDRACQLLHISLPTFHRWCKQGKLKVHKAGGRILVKKTDIDAAVEEVQNLKYRSPP